MTWVARLALATSAIVLVFISTAGFTSGRPTPPPGAGQGSPLATGAKTHFRPPPDKPGCYLYSSKGWVSQTCLSSEAVLKQGPPPTVAVGANPPGISLPSEGGGYLDGSYVVDLGEGDQSGSESDTTYGGNAWSVQNNTNFFAGNNGDTDWIQFVYQNFGSNNNRTCIWQIDITVARATGNTQGYNPTGCYNTSEGPEIIWGFDHHNAGGPSELGIESLSISGAQQASVVSDEYGLSNGNAWNAASGGILGAGGASEAVFSPGWLEYNYFEVSDCSYFDVCNHDKHLPTTASEFASNVTGESSNLTTPSTPAIHWANNHHSAYLKYDSSAPST